MTKITFVTSKGRLKGFECNGHADYSKRGDDIVCASISVLAINTCNSIEKLLDDKFKQQQDEKNGIIRFSIIGDPSDEAELLLKSFQLGATEVAKEYGKKYVKVEIQEV